MARVLGTNVICIESCFAVIGKARLTKYQDIQNLKAASKGFVDYYFKNIKYSISSLQNKLSEDIESIIIHSLTK